jgi:hypothetical protein
MPAASRSRRPSPINDRMQRAVGQLMSVTFRVAAIAAILACALNAAPAHAQSARTFVSGAGSDSNNCAVTTPCRTFQAAYNAVTAGGEIDVLDPAGYGPLTIQKAVSVQGHGFAGITAPANGPGVDIDAGASDAINLRGLLIEGDGSSFAGIHFISGASLNVQDCVIRILASPEASNSLRDRLLNCSSRIL